MSESLELFFGLQDLTAAIFAGFQIDVVGTAQLAALLILDIGWTLEGIRRAP
jgi:hypothetical protein